MANKLHLLHKTISGRIHPVTITVIGAGGNGSFFLQELARIAWTYETLFENGFAVDIWDGDTVEEHNLGS